MYKRQEFNRFTNSPVANYKGELYSLPFNMYTFNKMWGVVTPEEAVAKIEEQRKEAGIIEPENLEEQAISLVGRDIYKKLIKGYTEKQWGRDCKDLPSFIIKRLPVRLTFDNNYFNALYQGDVYKRQNLTLVVTKSGHFFLAQIRVKSILFRHFPLFFPIISGQNRGQLCRKSQHLTVFQAFFR